MFGLGWVVLGAQLAGHTSVIPAEEGHGWRVKRLSELSAGPELAEAHAKWDG